MQRWGSGHDWYLVVDAQRCHAFATIEEMGIEDEDKLDLVKRQRGGKPVIYVFPPETLEAEVKLFLDSTMESLCHLSCRPHQTPHRSLQRTSRLEGPHSCKWGPHRADDRIGRLLLVLGSPVRHFFTLLGYLFNNWFQHRCYRTTFPPLCLHCLGNRVEVSSSISTPTKRSSMTKTQLLYQSPSLRRISIKLWLPWAFIPKHAPRSSRSCSKSTVASDLFNLIIPRRYWLPSILKHQHLAFRLNWLRLGFHPTTWVNPIYEARNLGHE